MSKKIKDLKSYDCTNSDQIGDSDIPTIGSIKQNHHNYQLQQNSIPSKSNDSDEVCISDVKVSNIIGDFGPYQIAVVIFAALRAMSCAMDGLSGPFIAPTIRNYQCEVCDISSSSPFQHGSRFRNNITASFKEPCSLYLGDAIKTRYEIDTSQCYFDNSDSIRPDRIYCDKWSFNSSDNLGLMNTLTVEQSLVCDREWLKSLSNSMYFVGATFGLLFWGIISDRYGRKTAYVCSHFVTLIFGFSSLFAQSITTFILLRAINAFGMIGELIPRSIQVEIVATEYRFVCSVICQIGWATGIILVPALSYLNPNYRFILAFPVLVSFLMIPWLIWLPESARWLVTNQNYPKAREELIRAAKINNRFNEDTDSKIEQFTRQVLREEATTIKDNKRMGVWRSILAIFTNMHLLKDTLSVFTLLFVAEVVYFSLTLNVADLGGSLYINYIISGLSELVSIAFCAMMLAYLSRRMCLSLLLIASTLSYLLMALVNVYEDHLSMTIILAVNAFGKLTAIGNLMVIILVSQEVFPTVIRQFGTSLCITVGKAGSAVAPFTHELGQSIGQSYCFAMFSIICLSCAIIPFGLSETGNRELPDTVIDVEEGARRKKQRRKQKLYRPVEDKNINSNNSYNFSNCTTKYKSNEHITKLNSLTDINNNSNLNSNNNNNFNISNKNNNNNNNNNINNNKGSYDNDASIGNPNKNNLGLNLLSDSFGFVKQKHEVSEDLNNNNTDNTFAAGIGGLQNGQTQISITTTTKANNTAKDATNTIKNSLVSLQASASSIDSLSSMGTRESSNLNGNNQINRINERRSQQK